MIEISNLLFSYPEGAFSLRVPAVDEGERVAMIGPSGSGKTTLVNLIAGIATPREGSVTTDGSEVSSLGEIDRHDFRIRHIGQVFQEFELLEHLDVPDNVLLPYRINAALHLGHCTSTDPRASARGESPTGSASPTSCTAT